MSELNDDLSVSLVDKIGELVTRGNEVVETRKKRKESFQNGPPIFCRKNHFKFCSNCRVNIFQFTISSGEQNPGDNELHADWTTLYTSLAMSFSECRINLFQSTSR